VAEAVARVASHEESELAHALSAVANGAAEAVTAAVTELVAGAASHGDSPLASPAGESAFAAQAEATEARAGAVAPEITETTHAASQHLAADKQEPPVSAEGSASSTPVEEGSSVNTREPQSAEPVSAVAEGPVQNESAAGGTGAMAEKRESDLAATTAAAWASWRQIRSDEPRTTEPAKSRKHDDEDDEPTPAAEAAAMAVATGAEKSPEDGASDPRAIANIVDSVLAELRPKIVEEISKKLGEKK
jgi:hypothetical protein